MSAASSHLQILKASSIIGIASVINILVGMVRTKALAVLLGPAGVGLSGLYVTIMGLAGTLSGFGIGSSGVRQVAAAIGQGDDRAVSVARKVLWYANVVSGLLGALVLWLVREPVSEWVFGDASEATAVGLLGIGLILGSLGSSQTALLQGFRRIGDMAHAGILGAVIGSVIAVGCVAALGREGVLWFVIVNPAVNVLIAWRYAARLPRPQHAVSRADAIVELKSLVTLGFAFMATGLMGSGTSLLLRTLLTRELGLETVGQFQAASAISMQYIGFVLGAMGADYYPRLTAAIADRELANRLVNEQMEVALLLGGPVILAMLTFVPLVIDLLYAPSFRPAAATLSWQVMGDLLKIAQWPIGFIVLAQGAGSVFFWTQFSWNLAYLGLVWLLLPALGLLATGVSFLAVYIFTLGLVSFFAWRLNGFRWSGRNLRLLMGLLAAATLIQGSRHAPHLLEVAIGAAKAMTESPTLKPFATSLLEILRAFREAFQSIAEVMPLWPAAEGMTYTLGGVFSLAYFFYAVRHINRTMNIGSLVNRKLLSTVRRAGH